MSLQRTMKRAIKRGDSTCTARESRVREGRPASAKPGKMRKKVQAFMLKKQRLARFTTAILMRAAGFGDVPAQLTVDRIETSFQERARLGALAAGIGVRP